MVKRLLLLALIAFLGLSTANAQFTSAELNFLKTPFKVQSNGDALVGVRLDGMSNTYGLPSVKDFMTKFSSKEISPSGVTVSLVDIGARSIYDLCSNGSAVSIWQDPATPTNIHAVFMCSPSGDPAFTERLAKYYLSTDKGLTWSFIADVPSVRSGFPTISGFSDGSALISSHTGDGGAVVKSQAYKDLAPGLGSFTRLDAPGNNAPYVWPRALPTANLTLANKFLMMGSINVTTGLDTARINTCTNADATPGTWLGWSTITDCDNAESYALARGADGRIGLLYKSRDNTIDANFGSVYFKESTDNGTTFGTATKIFQGTFGAGGDSLACLRGTSLVYAGNIPKAVFETVTISHTTAGSYYPGLNAKIRFWSTSLSGSDPNRSIVIADTNRVGYHPYFGIADVMAPLCRPSIGVSSDGNALFCAFMVPSNQVGGIGADTTVYCDIYLTASINGGSVWSIAPTKINPVTPVKDWRYVSVSPYNDIVGSIYSCNMVSLRGNMPGSYVTSQGNGESIEQFWSIRANVTFTSVNTLSNEIPSNYSLSQNYPNPFNPTTNINFAISKTGFVSLKVYDLAGKEVSSLVNENLSTGTYNYTMDASKLSSGIYFYTLRTNDFLETKKMMLIK